MFTEEEKFYSGYGSKDKKFLAYLKENKLEYNYVAVSLYCDVKDRDRAIVLVNKYDSFKMEIMDKIIEVLGHTMTGAIENMCPANHELFKWDCCCEDPKSEKQRFKCWKSFFTTSVNWESVEDLFAELQIQDGEN
jgi:hypothetical protein